MTEIADTTPTELMTPETYLGSARIQNFAGRLHPDAPFTYSFPAELGQNKLAYSGEWRIEKQIAQPLRNARLRLHFVAKKVYIVLGGKGRVDVYVNGVRKPSLDVNGDRLYTVVDSRKTLDAVLELRFPASVSGYSFTFG
jgi:thioredoxin family protein